MTAVFEDRSAKSRDAREQIVGVELTPLWNSDAARRPVMEILTNEDGVMRTQLALLLLGSVRITQMIRVASWKNT